MLANETYLEEEKKKNKKERKLSCVSRGEGRQRGKRWDLSNLEMIVALPWRKNEDDAKMDGECRKRRSRDDGQGLQGEGGDEGTCFGARESVHNT